MGKAQIDCKSYESLEFSSSYDWNIVIVYVRIETAVQFYINGARMETKIYRIGDEMKGRLISHFIVYVLYYEICKHLFERLLFKHGGQKMN